MVQCRQKLRVFSEGGSQVTSVPIDQRVLKRSRVSDYFTYDGLRKNVVDEFLLYVALAKELLDNAFARELSQLL
jgi:hypothetical protein